MARTISSAEPEKLFRYSDLCVRLDRDLVSEASRLTARLQHFEARCTEPGYQVSVGHLGDALREHGRQSEETDSWVRQVGHGFQVADWGWMGARALSGVFGATERFLPSPVLGAAWGAAALLPLLPISGWLERIVSSVPWIKQGIMPLWSGWMQRWKLARQQVDPIWNLGSLFEQPTSPRVLILPAAGAGIAVVGLGSLIPLSDMLSTAQDFGERVWSWLRSKRADVADFAGNVFDAFGPKLDVALSTQKAFVKTMWWPLGKLLNNLARNQRAGFIGKLGNLGRTLYRSPVVKSLKSPIGKLFSGTLVSGSLDFITDGDYSWRGAGAAYTHGSLTTAMTIPKVISGIAGKIVVANAAVQIGGCGIIWGVTRIGTIIASPKYDQALLNNEHRTSNALKRIDLTRITKSAVNILWGKDDWTDLGDSVIDVVAGTWDFANAWGDQIALTGIAAGDRLYDAIQDTIMFFGI